MHRSRSRRSVLGPVLTAVVALLLTAGCPGLAANDKDTPATGRVHYTMTSPMMSGTMTMAWIDHGKKFRQDTKMSAGGPSGQKAMDTWTVGDGTYVYTHRSMMGNQVMRMRVPKSLGANPLGPAMTPGSGKSGKVVGKGTILGHPCEIRVLGPGGKGGQAKIWTWKGMALRMETTGQQGSGLTMAATRVETAPSLSPDLFKVPAGYQVRDIQLPAGGPGGSPRRSP